MKRTSYAEMCQMKFKRAGKCYYNAPVVIISLLFLAGFELANVKF